MDFNEFYGIVPNEQRLSTKWEVGGKLDEDRAKTGYTGFYHPKNALGPANSGTKGEVNYNFLFEKDDGKIYSADVTLPVIKGEQ